MYYVDVGRILHTCIRYHVYQVFIVEFNHSVKLKNHSLQDTCWCEYFDRVNSFLVFVQVLYIQPVFKVEKWDYLRVDKDLNNANAPPLFASRWLYEYQSEFPSSVTRNSPSQSDHHTKRGSRTRCILLQRQTSKLWCRLARRALQFALTLDVTRCLEVGRNRVSF